MKKQPPTKTTKSLQMDLFGQFVSNNDSEVSNTIELWESIPKYFFTPHKMKKLRTESGHADPFEFPYIQNNKQCTVIIQPALIKQKDGTYKAFFPSVTEELVEEALKKILCDQQYAFHDVSQSETWIRFTLRMVQKELKTRGRDRKTDQIKHAIHVMNKCIISFSVDGEEIWSGNILQDLVTVGREKFEADNTAHHIARLPLFLSQSINSLDYRQFNYDRLMSCNEQATRWIYKRLINRYTQANHTNSYHFMFSDVKHSGLLQQSTERDNRKKLISCLEELTANQVITRYTTNEVKTGRRIIDIKYTLYPTPKFIAEQKASNKRNTDNLVNINNDKSISVDK